MKSFKRNQLGAAAFAAVAITTLGQTQALADNIPEPRIEKCGSEYNGAIVVWGTRYIMLCAGE